MQHTSIHILRCNSFPFFVSAVFEHCLFLSRLFLFINNNSCMNGCFSTCLSQAVGLMMNCMYGIFGLSLEELLLSQSCHVCIFAFHFFFLLVNCCLRWWTCNSFQLEWELLVFLFVMSYAYYVAFISLLQLTCIFPHQFPIQVM